MLSYRNFLRFSALDNDLEVIPHLVVHKADLDDFLQKLERIYRPEFSAVLPLRNIVVYAIHVYDCVLLKFIDITVRDQLLECHGDVVFCLPGERFVFHEFLLHQLLLYVNLHLTETVRDALKLALQADLVFRGALHAKFLLIPRELLALFVESLLFQYLPEDVLGLDLVLSQVFQTESAVVLLAAGGGDVVSLVEDDYVSLDLDLNSLLWCPGRALRCVPVGRGDEVVIGTEDDRQVPRCLSREVVRTELFRTAEMLVLLNIHRLLHPEVVRGRVDRRGRVEDALAFLLEVLAALSEVISALRSELPALLVRAELVPRPDDYVLVP